MKNDSVKKVVATGIGAALFFVLARFVAIPSGIPNTNIALQYGIQTVFAVLYAIFYYIKEPFKLVLAQLAVAAVADFACAMIVGGLLLFGYSKTIAKTGSLDKE